MSRSEQIRTILGHEDSRDGRVRKLYVGHATSDVKVDCVDSISQKRELC